LAVVALTALLGFVVACGDDDGATPTPAGPETGTISGNVKDDAGANIAGASVSTNPATTFTLTDANGNFTIPDVPTGSVTVIATKAGFDTDAAQVTVVEGETVNVNLVLTPTGPIGATTGILSGIVVRRDGSPVAGVTVNIVTGGTCDGTPVTTATTDAGGGFLVEDLDPGTYLACVTTTIGGQEFTGRAGFVITAGAVSSVTITVGRELNQTTEPNVGGTPVELDASGKFEGDIHFVDWDADGTANEDCNIIFTQHLWVVEVTQDVDAAAVSGVRVEWSLNQAGGGVPVTDDDGNLIFIRGTTGVIVDSDDPFLDPVQAEQSKTVNSGASPQFVVDATHAVTYTNDDAQDIDFNGTTVSLSAGQSWIIVTSPQEGFTDVVASSPDLSRATEPNGDKDFAIKRWVNWRIEVAELTEDTLDFLAADPGLIASIAADGDTLVDRLDRTPNCTGADDSICDPDGAGPGNGLNNNAFIGVVISRLRLDSPFTFLAGTVDFAITDPSPDTDVADIDSDEDLGGAGFTLGSITADDDDGVPGCTEANTTPCDELASELFEMDAGPVTFQCEVDALHAGECLDVDVLETTLLNSAGQALEDMGFTITSGVTTEEAAVAVTIQLDPTIYFAYVGAVAGQVTCTSPQGFCFSDALLDLINGQTDDTSAFTVTILDEFGEVCDEIEVGKRWVTSIIRLFKQGPTTVSVGQQFTYTVTAVNDGDTESTNVIVADTLPIVDNVEEALETPGDRDSSQAFRYVTDDPTFDPAGIRYYIDVADDEPGTATNVCFEAPIPPALPAAFATPALCPATLPFASIADARTAAEDASADGDQVVIVEYFDTTLLSRTQPGGDIEAEDSFEITVEAIASVNSFRLDDGSIPEREEENGEWCNIATVTSAENDFAADTVCTRVVEALLEVRKTATDAIVPAGDQTSFTIEIGNNGSDDLINVTVSDTLDATLDLVQELNLCTGCTIDFGADSTIITITVPVVPPTDLDEDGVFDDDEGFFVVELVVRTPLADGTFCNRVTVADELGNSDTDLACVVTQVEIEFDIRNADGLIVGGAFTDVEVFEVGDTVAYQTLITNRSDVAATNVDVIWDIAANNGILQLLDLVVPPDLADPVDIACDTGGGPSGTGECTVTVASLAPDASIALNYRTIAQFSGNDVNRITLDANELSNSVLNEEPTTVNP
jgi:uncharacterized repeat protein (TIGR01451 family)